MKKRTSSKVANQQPSTSQNLYSMIYASRQKNLVSNYLKDMDQKLAKKGGRNTNLNAPQGTKKQISRNTLDASNTMALKSSKTAGRYYE